MISIQERTDWEYVEPFKVIRIGKFIPLIFLSPTHLAFENDGNRLTHLNDTSEEKSQSQPPHI